ncbi:hypothetical protein SAMN06264868_104102 [Venenivibrio stagnispumantis]|uniref:GspL periplasmic domain-containing protein n=1 Tax=Venenivibrio stagnispumantis TaxID=407998 RepID=A0AA46ADS8_9AQUI|nr:hypothetical protein [Venenivibrio stagnispumantis]MCW4573362.1 hypothetical protein [Venenivibrio stagnispumantis]SMP06880.1 hypothetical protein SAMN06264868_104102 [Venenivibrio stagnispumantis]
MEILALQLEKEEKIYAKINPLNKDIKISENLKNPKVVVSIPVNQTTFRYFKLDINDEIKLKKAVETSLKFDFPDFENIAFDFYKKNNDIFCVITKKEIVENIKTQYKSIFKIDSDIFAILRVLTHNNIKDADIIHFYPDYAVYIKVENSFPKFVRSLSINEAINSAKENNSIIVSGYIPRDINNPVLNNPLSDPRLNIAFGNLIAPLYDIGIDFLHQEDFFSFKKLSLITLSLVGVFIMINLSLFIKVLFLEKELKFIKNKEKIIYTKYFNEPAFEPVNQARGKVAKFQEDSKNKENIADILEFIGSKKSKTIDILFLDISQNQLSIKAVANTIEEVENFRKILNDKFSDVKIEESVKEPEGRIRFKIVGKR